MQAASPTYATPGRAFSNGVSAYTSRAPVELLEVFALEAPFFRGEVQRAHAIPITNNATITRATRRRGTQRGDAGWMGSFTAHSQEHSGSGSRLPRAAAIIARRFLCPQLTRAAAFRRSTFSESQTALVKAVAAVRTAVGEGFRDRVYLETEPDLEPIRNRDDFKQILGEIRLS
jgi:hypothetical protein